MSSADLPEHVEDSVQALAEVHVEHYRSASRRQRLVDQITSRLARPGSVIALGLIFAAWAAAIALEPNASSESFTGLELTATIAALLVAVLILVTQTQQDRLIERRAQLTLELVLVADKKLAKLVSLVEEIRCANAPNVAAEDVQAAEMAKPVNPNVVLEEIERRSNDERVG